MIPLPSDLAVVVVNAVFGDAPATKSPWAAPAAHGAGQGLACSSGRGGEAPAGNNSDDLCPDCNGVGVLTERFMGEYLELACTCSFRDRRQVPAFRSPATTGTVEGPTPPASIVAVDSLCVPTSAMAGEPSARTASA